MKNLRCSFLGRALHSLMKSRGYIYIYIFFFFPFLKDQVRLLKVGNLEPTLRPELKHVIYI